jgi:hypothetical protein
MYMMLFSSGYRKTLSTCRLHSGSSSKKSTPARGPRRSARHPRWDDGGAKRADRHQRSAGAGEAGDAMDARGLDGLGEGHGRQERGEPTRQPRRARPRRPQEQDVVGTTPAYYFASPMSLRMPMDLLLNLLVKLENQCRAIS